MRRPDGTTPSPLAWVASIALFGVAAGLYWYHGIHRTLAGPMGMVDLEVLWSGAKALLEGGDPYSREAMLAAAGKAPGDTIGLQITLPSMFVLMAPLAPFDFATASRIWMAISILSLVAIALMFAALARLPLGRPAGIAMLGVIVLLGPFRTQLWVGQVDIVGLALIVAALLLVERSPPKAVVAGVLLGIAIAYKPQNAGLFALYLMVRGHERTGFVALLSGGALVVLGAALAQWQAPGWLDTWAATTASPENVGWNRVSPDNASVYLFTHLHAGLYAVTGSVRASWYLSLAICAAVFAALVASRARSPESDVERLERRLRELAVVALVSLLVVYHRFGVDVLLAFPAAWAVHALARGTSGRLPALVVLASLSAALVNGQAAWPVLIERGLLGPLDGDSWIERVIVAYHIVWAQVLMLTVLLGVHFRRSVLSTRPPRAALATLAYRGRPAARAPAFSRHHHDSSGSGDRSSAP